MLPFAPVLPAMDRAEWVALFGVGALLELTGISWLFSSPYGQRFGVSTLQAAALLGLDLLLWAPVLVALFAVFDRTRPAGPRALRALMLRSWAMIVAGAIQTAASIAVGRAASALLGLDPRALDEFWAPDLRTSLPYTVLGLGAILVAHVVMSRIHLAERSVAREADLRAEAATAQLRALQAELQPHFLFNALNGIGELVHQEPARAEAMLLRLAGLLRGTLTHRAGALVPLREELAMVDDYLALQHMRFGDRLQVVRRVPPELLEVAVPPLLLQPLVENALIHGIERRRDAGVVELEFRRDGGTLVLTVRDDGPGPGRGAKAGTGVGLANVRERLARRYGGAASVTLEAASPAGALAMVRLPAWPEAT
ncbi:MAG: histidine kinase [Gemmatimonadales bacterium]|nr:histidine kinase [Gemmatimonadales bacterium]